MSYDSEVRGTRKMVATYDLVSICIASLLLFYTISQVLGLRIRVCWRRDESCC
jgi:hypothetical protein